MRVIMFQDRFAALVKNGTKRQTIRKTARCKVGDTLSLRRWSGKPYRSKQAVLREAVVERVREVEINHYDVFVDDERFPGQHLAVMDGFKDFEEMRDWFSTVHGLPFRGQLIQWSNTRIDRTTGGTERSAGAPEGVGRCALCLRCAWERLCIFSHLHPTMIRCPEFQAKDASTSGRPNASRQRIGGKGESHE